MAEKDKKYYWLKLKRDFFKRHDIQIIENMPNGKDYILFYLKLLCESVDHDGRLRFNEDIPYNEQMLATITNTNVDIVRGAITVFVGLKMMEVMDDGTYFMNEVQKMLGSETYWAQKKREQREKELEAQSVGQIPTLSNGSPTCPSKSIEKEIDKELDLDIEIDGEKESVTDSSNPTPAPAPTKSNKPIKHKKGEYGHVLLTDEQEEKLIDEYGGILAVKAITFLDEYIEMKGYKAKNHYLAIKKWVIDAVMEREQKQRGSGNFGDKQHYEADEWMQAATNRILNDPLLKETPKTAANDENLQNRVNALRERIGQ